MTIDALKRLLLRRQIGREKPRCYIDKKLKARVHVYVGASRSCVCGKSTTLAPERRMAAWRETRGKDWKAYLNGEDNEDKAHENGS